MSWNRKISDEITLVDVLPIGAAGSDPKTGTWVSMAGVGRVLARAKFAETTATVATLQLYQAKDETGEGAKPLGDEVSATTDATTAEAVTLTREVAAGQLDLKNDFTHVTAVVSYGTSDAVEATLILGDLAHRPPA